MCLYLYLNVPVVIPSTSVSLDMTHIADTSKEVPLFPPEEMDISSNTPPCQEGEFSNIHC